MSFKKCRSTLRKNEVADQNEVRRQTEDKMEELALEKSTVKTERGKQGPRL